MNQWDRRIAHKESMDRIEPIQRIEEYKTNNKQANQMDRIARRLDIDGETREDRMDHRGKEMDQIKWKKIRYTGMWIVSQELTGSSIRGQLSKGHMDTYIHTHIHTYTHREKKIWSGFWMMQFDDSHSYNNQGFHQG
jgi:hypothetical protein